MAQTPDKSQIFIGIEVVISVSRTTRLGNNFSCVSIVFKCVLVSVIPEYHVYSPSGSDVGMQMSRILGALPGEEPAAILKEKW